MSASSMARKRRAKWGEQGGVCYYCLKPVGHEISSLGDPHLDHYNPRCKGGRQLVLSCNWCGTNKGMMPGKQFEEIIKRHASSRSIGQARTDIARECKAINKNLNANHPPNVKGKERTAQRTAMIARQVKLVSLVFQEEPPKRTAAQERLWSGAYFQDFTAKRPWPPCNGEQAAIRDAACSPTDTDSDCYAPK